MTDQLLKSATSIGLQTAPHSFRTPHRKNLIQIEQFSPTSTIHKNPEVPFTLFDDKDDGNLLIFQNKKYNKLYKNVLKDGRKAAHYLKDQRLSQQKKSVKKSIQKILKQSEQKMIFNIQFSIKPRLRIKTSIHKEKETISQMTTIQKQAQTMQNFFSDHKKVINLQEQSLLLQYFLKDQQKQKRTISFVSTKQKTSRHRRLTQNTNDAHRLYSGHDEREYKSLKMRTHLKQRFIQQCSQMAKRNITFRRSINFKEMQYIQLQHSRRMMKENTTNEHPQNQQKQKILTNQIIRLFLKYQFQVYGQKAKNSLKKQKVDFSKFKEDLFSLDPIMLVKQKQIQAKIQEIMKGKQKKQINPQDFKQILLRICDISNLDVMALYKSKFPDYFVKQEHQLIKKNSIQIDKYMEENKIKFLLKIIFTTFPQKLLIGKYLPIKIIPSLFRSYEITQKDYDNTKLFTSYYWMQHYDAGLTFQQFYQGSILLGTKKNDWKGIEKLLKKIDVKKYI